MAKVGKPRFFIDREELMAWARVHAVEPLRERAEAVAANIRKKVPKDVPVGVMETLNNEGRPVFLVTVMHPSAAARQAKHGIVTKSAAEAGMDIVHYPPKKEGGG